MNLKLLSNGVLLQNLAELRLKERQTQALFLRHLAEVDRRRLYADVGYSSLFKFVTEALGYSPSSALKRIQVARASAEHSETISRLESGRISLTVLSKICPHLDDSSDLLNRVEGKSAREVESLLQPVTGEKAPDEVRAGN